MHYTGPNVRFGRAGPVPTETASTLITSKRAVEDTEGGESALTYQVEKSGGGETMIRRAANYRLVVRVLVFVLLILILLYLRTRILFTPGWYQA